MGLKSVLEKMRLVETEPRLEAPQTVTPTPAPARPAQQAAQRPVQRSVSQSAPIADLLRSIPEADVDVDAVPAPASGNVPDFEAIYRAAGIKEPAHGYSAFKVLEILSSPDLADLPPKAKAAALAGFLKMHPSGPVPVGDILQDAVRRDQALDKFEEFLRQKLLAAERDIEQKNAALQQEMDAIVRTTRERMDENRQALVDQQRSLSEWQARKRIEERRLYDAVGPFVEENPISQGGASAPSAKQ